MAGLDKLQANDKEAMNKAEKRLPSDELFSLVVEVFKALGDTTRAKILYLLREEKLCVRDIAILTDISESGVSHQLSELKEKKLVKAERDKNTMYYSIAYEHLQNLLQEAEYYADHIKSNIPDHPKK
jgi:DNA-binding transcriptional ArsR family regulator